MLLLSHLKLYPSTVNLCTPLLPGSIGICIYVIFKHFFIKHCFLPIMLFFVKDRKGKNITKYYNSLSTLEFLCCPVVTFCNVLIRNLIFFLQICFWRLCSSCLIVVYVTLYTPLSPPNVFPSHQSPVPSLHVMCRNCLLLFCLLMLWCYCLLLSLFHCYLLLLLPIVCDSVVALFVCFVC